MESASAGAKSSVDSKADPSKPPKANALAARIVQRVVLGKYEPTFVQGQQPVGLLAALLRLRLWSVARPLLEELQGAGIEPMLFPEVARAMSDLISWMIDPVYASISPRTRGLARPLDVDFIPALGTQPKQLASMDSFFNEDSTTLSFIRTLGHSMCASPTLLCQLCRILRVYICERLPNLSTVLFSISQVLYR